MSPKPLLILGTGGHFTVVLDIALALGFPIQGCIGPDEPPASAEGCPYLGDDSALASFNASQCDATVGVGSIGDPKIRRRLFERLGAAHFHVPALIHPRAIVARSAIVGDGTQVMAGAVVQPHVIIRRNTIINTGSVVEHHSIIDDHVHVAPGAVVCGGCRIGLGSHIGANATVLQNLVVGAHAIVGAGAVVLRDIPDGGRATGIVS